MTTMRLLVTALSGAVVALFLSGCVDIEPLRAEVEDLKLQVTQLQASEAKLSASSQAANTRSLRLTADADAHAAQALAASDANATAINAVSEKLDRMFKRPLSKQETPP